MATRNYIMSIIVAVRRGGQFLFSMPMFECRAAAPFSRGLEVRTYLRLRLQGVFPVRPRKRGDDGALFSIRIVTHSIPLALRLALRLGLRLRLRPRARQKCAPECVAHENAPDPMGALVDGGSQARQRCVFRVPEPAAHETTARLSVHVVAGVGALAARPRPSRGVVGLFSVRLGMSSLECSLHEHT